MMLRKEGRLGRKDIYVGTAFRKEGHLVKRLRKVGKNAEDGRTLRIEGRLVKGRLVKGRMGCISTEHGFGWLSIVKPPKATSYP